MKKSLMKNYEIICKIGLSFEDSDTLKHSKTAGFDMSHATIEELKNFVIFLIN